MKLRLLILILISALGFSNPVIADVMQGKKHPVLTVDSARIIADAEFRKITNDSVKRFSVQLIQNDKQEIVFAYEDLDVALRPGGEIYITVNKKTRKVAWRHGY